MRKIHIKLQAVERAWLLIMHDSSSNTARQVEQMIKQYGDMLFRLCLVMLKNKSDAEDAVQETVLKYMLKAPHFENAEHEKAWLIRVAANKCLDIHRSRKRHPQTTVDELQGFVSAPESCGIIEALMTIPEKFRIVMLLYYVEEYSIKEIARMIDRSDSAVKMRLSKGRLLLEKIYREEYL